MILCLDMDAFFASVEQAANPKLRGKPVGVVGRQHRTVVVTSSYEARKLGVKTGMSRFEALRVCPSLEVVPAHNRIYTYISSKIMEFLKKEITPDVEVYSVDEAFLDLSCVSGDPISLGYIIKSFVKKNFDITCSVGIGANKLIAKMASGVNKPDGIYQVAEADSEAFMDRFRLEDIWGIGRRLTKRFNSLGMYYPKDLRQFGEDNLIKMLGVNGSKIYNLACGKYPPGVSVEEPPVKSIGHSFTLPKDVRSERDMASYVLQLSEMVSSRARKNRFSGKTISVYLRFPDMTGESTSKTIPFFTAATHHIYETAMELAHKLWAKRPQEGIRLISITISNLVEECVSVAHIMEADKNYESLYQCLDDINEKYGKQTVTYASVLNCERRGSRIISPAWRPDGTRHINVK